MRFRLLILFLMLYATSPLAAASDFYSRLADSCLSLTKQEVIYNPAYFSIPYPNGDVPKGFGVCTDVIIRAYRKMGIDLQQKVHEDMKAHFSLYPALWGLNKTDWNIDHRRVPNLMCFFSRFGTVKKNTDQASDYEAGDIVCWNLGGNVTHIGILVHMKSLDGQRCMVVHNIGNGQKLEDCLFRYKIIGHYRYGA